MRLVTRTDYLPQMSSYRHARPQALQRYILVGLAIQVLLTGALFVVSLSLDRAVRELEAMSDGLDDALDAAVAAANSGQDR